MAFCMMANRYFGYYLQGILWYQAKLRNHVDVYVNMRDKTLQSFEIMSRVYLFTSVYDS